MIGGHRLVGATAALAAATAAAAVALGCGGGDGPAAEGGVAEASGARGPEPEVVLPAGEPPTELVVEDLRVGRGRAARIGDELVAHFVSEYVTGERYESTWDADGKPFTFQLGIEEPNPGWERGLVGMRVGGRRQLVVPPRLTSWDRSATEGGPETTLVYVIDLLAARVPGTPASRSRVMTAAKHEPSLSVPRAPPPGRLVKRDLIEGTGRVAKRGEKLRIEYVGLRYDGDKVANSWVRTKPFDFILGTYDPLVIPGWQKGIAGMRAGGQRQLIVPPRLLYENGAPPGSTPSETVVYVIDLVTVRR